MGKYEEALERAKAGKPLDEVFPELKESEDEKIRKEIIRLLSAGEWSHSNGISRKEMLSYLEKQKEQKPFNVCEQCPYYKDCPGYNEQKSVERSLEDDHIIGFVYDLLESLSWRKDWAMSKDECLRLLGNYIPEKSAECVPDSIKFDEGFKTGREVGFREGVESVKPAEWSEEDEWKRNELLKYLEEKGDYRSTWYSWLKSLPERFNLQPKQEWSEEDREMKRKILKYLSTRCNVFEYEEIENWLNNLRPQPHWKPNKEQMNHLAYACTQLKLQQCYAPHVYKSLESLYDDLQKLL